MSQLTGERIVYQEVRKKHCGVDSVHYPAAYRPKRHRNLCALPKDMCSRCGIGTGLMPYHNEFMLVVNDVADAVVFWQRPSEKSPKESQQ